MPDAQIVVRVSIAKSIVSRSLSKSRPKNGRARFLPEVGLGLLEIAKTLNQQRSLTHGGNSWKKTVIRYAPKKGAYVDILVFNRGTEKKVVSKVGDECIRVEHAHPTIVSVDIFQRVQSMLHERSRK